MPDTTAIGSTRNWIDEAVSRIEADQRRSADTHLWKLEVPAFPEIDLYLKDESTHPTGSLKHRLARSLFLYALCNGKIQEGTAVVEASSGSTAVSEAYFARMIGVPPADSAMKALGKTFEYAMFEGAGHGFLRQQDGRDGANLAATRAAWPRTVEWFRRHLAGEPRVGG